MPFSQPGRPGVSRRNLLRGVAAAGAGLAAGQAGSGAGARWGWSAAPERAAAGGPAAQYSMWYLEYANAPRFPVSGLLYGAHNQGTTRLPFTYTVIKGMGTVAMFDVGFKGTGRGSELATAFGGQDWESPERVLGKIGMSPAEVEHVFIGHAHFDHIDNLAGFPNAHVYVQEREITAWMNALQLPRQFGWITAAMNPENIMESVQRSLDGRLTLVQGEMPEVLPGIDIHPAHDTHTFGTQYITVTMGAGNSAQVWAITGDAIYLYGNVEGDPRYNLAAGVYVPIGYGQGNQVTQLEIMDEVMQRVGGDTHRIVPGHDRAVFERFPSRQIGPNSIAELVLAPGERSRL